MFLPWGRDRWGVTVGFNALKKPLVAIIEDSFGNLPQSFREVCHAAAPRGAIP
jgi:hypothetical protein